MKKILYISILLSMVYCSDFLRVEPIEQISINNQLKDKKGMKEALYGAYITLRNVIFNEKFAVYADLQAGNLAFTPNASGNISVPSSIANLYNFEDLSTSSNMADFYTNSYSLINAINLILSKVEDIPDATHEEKMQIKAETLAMRAYVHFQLAKIYAQNYTYTSNASHLGIVYNTQVLKVGEDYPSRKTVRETFELLEKDIMEAISLYQSNRIIELGNDRNYINKNVAKAIAADIFLWKNDWQKAYDYSQELINTPEYSLSNYVNIDNWASSEMIFELPNTINDESPISRIYSASSTARPNYNLSTEVYHLFDATDKRLSLLQIRNYRTAGQANPPYYFSKKYSANVDNALYRLTEMYFIRAEAALHLNNQTQALADINAIRRRAGIPEVNSISIDDILLEKRKEFIFENKYFFDLIRNHRNIERNRCLSTNCNMSYPNDKFVLPIPEASINLNTNMKQNPSY